MDGWNFSAEKQRVSLSCLFYGLLNFTDAHLFIWNSGPHDLHACFDHFNKFCHLQQTPSQRFPRSYEKEKKTTRCVTSLNRQPIKKRAVNTGRVQLTYMGLTNPCHIKIRVQVIMHSLIMSTLIGRNLKRTGRRSVSKWPPLAQRHPVAGSRCVGTVILPEEGLE